MLQHNALSAAAKRYPEAQPTSPIPIRANVMLKHNLRLSPLPPGDGQGEGAPQVRESKPHAAPSWAAVPKPARGPQQPQRGT
jgi:hypothetical protein